MEQPKVEDTTTIDFSNESCKILESAGRLLKTQLRKIALRKFFVWGVLAAGSLLLLLVALLNLGEQERDPFLYNMSMPMKIATLGLSFLIFVVSIIYMIGSLKGLVSRPPTAPDSAEECIRQFYSGPLECLRLVCGGLGRIGTANWVNAFVCLLDQAKNRVGNYKGFITYWKNTSRQLRDQLEKIFAPQKPWQITISYEKLDKVRNMDGLETYFVMIRIDASQGSILSMEKIGYVFLVENVSVIQVGMRWYKTTALWTGQIQRLR